MIPNSFILKRVGAAAIMVATIGVATGLKADRITLLKLDEIPGPTRTLSFPTGQCTGNLYLEPESGPGWDPRYVRPYGEWTYLAAAQGDVRVPENRYTKLQMRLALSPKESARLRAENPQAYQLTTADRVRKDPQDLSGLSQLDPNDLFWLSAGTEMYLRTGADPEIFAPISDLTGLRLLTLYSSGITDEGLGHLRSLRSLRGLELTQSSISSRGLAVLAELPALEYLSLNTGVTDAGLRKVAQMPNLRWLSIADGKMWGPGLAELAKLPRLERLCIVQSRSPLYDRHIQHMEGLTRLKSLTLWGSACNSLTDASLASIGKLKNLEELYFIRAHPRFSVSGVAYLKRLKKLKKVDFAQIWAGPPGADHGDEVARQLAALPNLESIKGLSYLSADGIKALTALRNLKCLGIGLKNRRQGYHGPTGISYLADLGFLEDLHLSCGEPLSDADLACLESLSRLRELFISGQNVTERGMASIGKLKELEKLTIFCPVTRNALNQLNGLANLQYLQVNAHPRGNPSVAHRSDELTLDLSGLKNMKDMNLSSLPLRDSDLTFLKDLPLLENLAIQPVSTLSASSLRHFREIPELNRLFISQISDCTAEDLANLNNLPKLRSLTLTGDISDASLSSIENLSSLSSLRVDTDEPIRRQTVTDLTRSNPSIEYIHINEKMRIPTRPPQQPQRKRDNRPRAIRRAPRRQR